jgi:tetratricopeptide (TPR) repeat protein
VSATFIFGAATAIIFRYLRVERNQSEAARPSMHHHLASEAALHAEQLMEDGNQSGAEAVLKTILQKNPDAVDALMLLQQVHFRKSEMPEYQAVTVKLCQVCVKKRDLHGAWQAYEEYLNSGGQDMPPATWLELSRVAEELQMFDRAVAEYEKIIATLPNTRESLMAQLRAAKILLKQLAQPGQALQMFQGAYSSPIPHLDFEQAIETGIRESKVALSMAGTIPVTD